MTILCYGDSNTWGYRPGSGGRFDTDIRWPAVMASCLGPGYRVIEEGLNGRTLSNFFPRSNPLNGRQYIEHLLTNYPNIDILIMYLGINDLFHRNDIGTEEIAREAGYAIELIQSQKSYQNRSIEILLLSPLPVNLPEEISSEYRLQIIKSESFYDEFRKVADAYDVKLLDTGRIIRASLIDGVHIDAENHKTLGQRLGSIIYTMAD